MTRILQIHASLAGADGRSSRLATRFVERYSARSPDVEITVRDLGSPAVPHLDSVTFQRVGNSRPASTPDRDERVALSDTLLDELLNADLIVLGVPMYNFGIPSALKAWFDHVARAGVTFRYTEHGPVGLLRNKRAVVVHARGGRYADTPADHLTPHVDQLLDFLGIERIGSVFAEGLASDDGDAALRRAGAALDELVDRGRLEEAA